MRAALLLVSVVVSFNVLANDQLAEVSKDIASGEYQGVTGGIVSSAGQVILEAYAPGIRPENKSDIRSATKSITSLLIGQLLEDRKLNSVHQRIAKLLPEEFENIPDKDFRRSITIEDILTMRTGLACNDWVPSSLGQEDKMYKAEDWAKFILNVPQAYEVGKHFSYCTGGVVMLGRIIQKYSGMSVPEYAEAVLFKPLGITGAEWAKTPKGYTDTGGHLELSLSDLHALGQLILYEGMIDGTQVIAKKWIKRSIKEHTKVYERRETYGYLWWRNEANVNGQKLTLIYAHGNGGNFIFVLPEINMVAAFTGVNYGKPEQFTALRLLSQKIVPALLENR